MDRRVLAVISARAGSKGVPGKNLKPLGGKPLIAHMIEAATRSRLVTRVVVSTEDSRIADTARTYGADVPFVRPAHLADDSTPLLAVTKHAMEELDRQGWRADAVVQLAPTCPFIPTSKIDEAIEKVLEPGSDCIVSVRRIGHEHPYRAKRLVNDEGVFAQFIDGIDVERYLSRQDLPPAFCTTGGIYARQRGLLERWNGKDFCLGPSPRAVILDEIAATNIDGPLDFAFADFILSQYADAVAR